MSTLGLPGATRGQGVALLHPQAPKVRPHPPSARRLCQALPAQGQACAPVGRSSLCLKGAQARSPECPGQGPSCSVRTRSPDHRQQAPAPHAHETAHTKPPPHGLRCASAHEHTSPRHTHTPAHTQVSHSGTHGVTPRAQTRPGSCEPSLWTPAGPHPPAPMGGSAALSHTDHTDQVRHLFLASPGAPTPLPSRLRSPLSPSSWQPHPSGTAPLRPGAVSPPSPGAGPRNVRSADPPSSRPGPQGRGGQELSLCPVGR